MLKDIYIKYDFFIITYPSLRSRSLPYSKVLIPRFTKNVFQLLKALGLVLHAFLRERPDLIISTGAEIALPVFLIGKLFGSKTIFIETMTALEKPTLTGRILYHFSNRFLVQNQESLQAYGPRAEFHGSLL